MPVDFHRRQKITEFICRIQAEPSCMGTKYLNISGEVCNWTVIPNEKTKTEGLEGRKKAKEKSGNVSWPDGNKSSKTVCSPV